MCKPYAASITGAPVGRVAQLVCADVPEGDGRMIDAVVRIAKNAERCGVEQQVLCLLHG